MAKKGKNSRFSQQPNAPELQQILHQQPPHNPYYPDIGSSQLLPPPSYSESSTARNHNQQPLITMAQVNSPGHNVNYTSRQDYPVNRGAASVIIQQVPYNHRAERYSRKVRSFNNQLLLIAIIAALSSLYAYSLYKERNCIFNFVIHKPNKDLEIKIDDVKDMHLSTAYASAFIILLCVIKSASGYRDKSYSCYFFIIGVTTFLLTIFTGYMAYLAFYSPCAPRLNEIFTNSLKTVVSSFTDKLPAPQEGFFGEKSVFEAAEDDRKGVVIFIIDVFNFAFYFAAFLTSTFLC